MITDNLAFLIKHISIGVDKYVNNELKECGLTITQMRVMGFVKRREGLETSFSDIEEFLNVSHPTVIGVIKRLEQNGFVEVKTSQIDKRVRLVYLTDKHNELFKAVDMSQNRLEGMLSISLTDKEVVSLKKYLNIVMSNLKELNDKI